MAANQLSYEFLEIYAQFDLTQLVSFPTRGENYLDLILTTNPEKFSEVMVHVPVLTSDHNLVSCTLITETAANKPAEEKPNFFRADYTIIHQMLSAVNWRAIFMNYRSVNDYWSAQFKLMWDVISINVPKSSHHSTSRRHDLAVPPHVKATIFM